MLVPRSAWASKYPMLYIQCYIFNANIQCYNQEFPECGTTVAISLLWVTVIPYILIIKYHFTFQIPWVSWNLVHNVCSRNVISYTYLKDIVLLLYTSLVVSIVTWIHLDTLVQANKWFSKFLASCTILQIFFWLLKSF